jgi:uncharacterized protein
VTAEQISERIVAFGHRNMLATHPSTLMITKETEVTLAGDCIIAVASDKSGADFSIQFKKQLQKPNAKLNVEIEADGMVEKVLAYGSPQLILTHPTDMVIRKSRYVCSRTLAICADKAAKNLSRKLAEKLQNPKQQINITLTVQV